MTKIGFEHIIKKLACLNNKELIQHLNRNYLKGSMLELDIATEVVKFCQAQNANQYGDII